VETWKRVWKSAWRLEWERGQEWGRVWIEGTLWSREIHQTRPRAPFAGATYGGAARTASTGLRRPGRCRGGGEAWGPRIKYHPRYVPFENATFFSILSAFYSFASRRSLSLSLSLWISHLFLLLASVAFLASVVICILKFDNSSDVVPCSQNSIVEFSKNRWWSALVHWKCRIVTNAS